MSSDNKFWLGIWVIILLGLSVLILTIGIVKARNTRLAFEYGYEKAALPGLSAPEWQKVK